MLAYIYTLNGVSVFLNGKATSIAKDDPRYEPLTSALANSASEAEIQALIATPKDILQSEIDELRLSDLITIVSDVVYYKQRPIANSLTSRMLEHIRQGVDIKPMVPFLENLELNPSRRIEQNLYEFLERGKIPLTLDGFFVAYKAVRNDWKDIHSGTFDNSIGSIVEVPRNQVDEDPDRTCSHGLHVCSFDYLPSFAHADGHVIIVKVNPADVVAIPTDYNLTKMRVCRYEVIGEVDGYYAERRNILSESPLWGSKFPEQPEDPEDPEALEDLENEKNGGSGGYGEFAVFLYSSDHAYETDTWCVNHFFDSREEAEEYAKKQLDDLTPVVAIEDSIDDYQTVLRLKQ